MHAVVRHDAEYVTAVESGQDKKRCVEQIALNGHSSFADQMMPFERLHTQKYESAQNRQRHEVAKLRHVAVLNAAQRLDHREARTNQNEGHYRGGGDAEIIRG